ncbi:maleylpyruvate isomerase family mycothiol-dependent enzyme [Streptomyces sp. H27-D2]|uniref:maleylpyruvate isomerase family mycothiol-dependent enzyme n=1 Tax=Streptomyces sp. H27-D2 TaxID=3046304 RepID=UPI002DB6C160|nr:maleylpyruvate isomerase family mycothiol-dependent enzyme [Streptomyces sp. H27-D2]MEC4019059.1 maleylpyruvate isomerase family mycothiol-dependent enzyme [Streptomyces sp. H27-D2]
MKTADHIGNLRRDGQLLADAAQKAGVEAEVPDCPQWRVRDLVEHTGLVHRWATRFLVERLTEPVRPPSGPGLDGEELISWFRDGHGLLVEALTAAPHDLNSWTFLPAPSPLAFWARRQAHETAIHRVDAEAALRTSLTPVTADFASDGIDELLVGFHGRSKSKVRTDTPRTLRVRPTDASVSWTVRLSGEPPRTERTEHPRGASETDAAQRVDASAEAVDCELSGPAADLYFALWNRLPVTDLAVTGDPALARLWLEQSAVT